LSDAADGLVSSQILTPNELERNPMTETTVYVAISYHPGMTRETIHPTEQAAIAELCSVKRHLPSEQRSTWRWEIRTAKRLVAA
jgi:hypothetical protein